VTGSESETSEPPRPRVRITYCPKCRWLLRAGWMAQELLITFEHDLGEVALRPGGTGIFDVHLDETLIWSRATEGRFPELKELKQRIRDRVDPSRRLGHSDARGPSDGQ
jgi:selenoprotein W-related protein